MPSPRYVHLYDPAIHPSSWNERMVAGEYAVHFAGPVSQTTGTCAVLPSLAQAEEYAAEQIELHPEVQCRIYDCDGMVGAPVREITGSRYKGNTDLTPGVRRWLGSGLLAAGIGLIALDWAHSFRLMWAYTLGLPLLLPGIVLLAMELLAVLTAKRGRKPSGAA